MSSIEHERHELLSRTSFDSHTSARDFTAWKTTSRPHWARGIFRKIRHLQNPFPVRRGPTVRLVAKLICLVFGSILILSIFRAIIFPSYQNPPAHYNVLRDAVISSTQPGRGNPYGEKVFIAANILQADLIRGAWGNSVLELIDLLGEENVFLSIYENDSGPETAEALGEFREKVKCQSSIVTGDHLGLEGFPRVTLPSGERRVKRITYLAEIRNRALYPLNPPDGPSHESYEKLHGFQYTSMSFDRILFINDVYFSPLSALQLLFSTNLDRSTNRPSYRAACAADFIGYAMFYDTFVVRDLEGFGMGLMFYPWFTPSGRAESRNDVLAEKDAVRVKSCWGGMIALEAAPFQRPSENTTNVAKEKSLLRFRSEPEIFWECSECCLVHADMTSRTPPLDELQDTGIYINPFVRVAYKYGTYSSIPLVTRYERVFAFFQYMISRFFYPEYNPRRQDRAGDEVMRRIWDDGAYRNVKTLATPGGFCGQKRLFIMLDIQNGTNRGGKKNWEKVPVP